MMCDDGGCGCDGCDVLMLIVLFVDEVFVVIGKLVCVMVFVVSAFAARDAASAEKFGGSVGAFIG